jgi:RimJ/RimL family protein N-acetyltransferase
MTPPILHTERLTLRLHTMADFEDYAAFLATDRTIYMDGPLDRAGAWTWFTASVAHWPLFGHGDLMIQRKDSGAAIGSVGLTKGIDFPEVELGWMLYADHEGFGFATEAALALRDWAFQTLGLPTLVSYIDPPNARSIRVAEKLGGVLDAKAVRPTATDLVYRYAKVAA